MMKFRKLLLISIIVISSNKLTEAGPPFATDDPEPVEHKHWEYYISSISGWQDKSWSGTMPHFEVNYGVVPEVQLHLLLPVNYSYFQGSTNFGYSSTEIGVKYRFVRETGYMPQIGCFPIVEVPTVKNSRFGNGKVQVFLPVWLQKSWSKLTTYGGTGYWINPGTGNKNWLFTGWEVQYDFTETITLGGEVYYHTANDIQSKAATGFNIGGFINFSPKFHFIFSAGHSISGGNFFTSYAGVLWTI
jgi:hypothetical protein